MINRATFSVVWVLLLSMLWGANAFAEDYNVNAQARVFVPDILYIKPGDTVHWMNMTSHDTVSQDGMIPEGAKGWRGAIGENFSVTLTKEGVYPYICEPHIGFGMAGVIIVGKPVNIDAAMDYARKNLQGPKRRLIGKLLKVQRAAKKQ
jgi:pseudoazurin